jgi:hypothetical protein
MRKSLWLATSWCGLDGVPIIPSLDGEPSEAADLVGDGDSIPAVHQQCLFILVLSGQGGSFYQH